MALIKWLLLGLLLFNAQVSLASQKVTGYFAATEPCAAYSSFRHQRNPGEITLHPGSRYVALEINKTDWSWIRIEVEGGKQNKRWVARGCGQAEFSSWPQSLSCNGKPIPSYCNQPNQHRSNVLALSWQAGFCEHQYRPSRGRRKQECELLNRGDITITHLTLHGLWPNREECLICYGRCEGEEMSLRRDIEQQLSHWMPSYRYGDGLARHEWDKHGTCQRLEDDDYFDTALHFLEQVDQSPIGEYLREHIGRDVRVSKYEQYIEEKMGSDAASRIELVCAGKRKRYLQEIRLNLPRELNREKGNLLPMLRRGAVEETFRGNCKPVIHIEAPGL